MQIIDINYNTFPVSTNPSLTVKFCVTLCVMISTTSLVPVGHILTVGALVTVNDLKHQTVGLKYILCHKGVIPVCRPYLNRTELTLDVISSQCAIHTLIHPRFSVGFVLLDLQFYVYILQIVVCSFVLFLLAIVFSVLFDIWILISPLVSSNSF